MSIHEIQQFAQSPIYLMHTAVQRIDRDADQVLHREFNISYSQFIVMSSIMQLEQSSQKQLADCIGVTPAAISRQIEILCDIQMIIRTPKGGSRREYQLSLSVKGKNLVDLAKQTLSVQFDQLMRRFSMDEVSVFTEVLANLNAELS